MEFLSGLGGLLVLVGVLVVVILAITTVFAKNYVKVPKNKVAVFTGRGEAKIVNGGARFRMPLLEQVNVMSIEPFNIEAKVVDVYSKDNVPVSVTAVGQVKFSSSREAFALSTERYLDTPRDALKPQLTEIVSGTMRNIVSQLTVEELNGNREEFMRRVKDEAAQSFQPIGMQLDVFNIQNISDNNGYLDALGQRRIAEVKRDAVIGRANAERDAAIQSAAAEQQGKVARAQADTRIAEANQERDLRLSAIATEVDAAKARAGQAGPLAEAEAQRAVVLAGVRTDRERTEAQIGVEEQRARQQENAVQADVVIPAEAEWRAAVARAEGQRDADIASATAAARRRELQGKADADARSILAGASQKEREAEAAGNKALRLAEAEGIRAVMAAEADGQAKRAEALNQLSDQAARQNVLPQLIQVLPQLAEAIAKGVSIDRLVVVDGGGGGADGGGAIQRAISVTPAVLNQVLETAKGLGLDLSGLFGHVGIGTDAASPAADNGAASPPLASAGRSS